MKINKIAKSIKQELKNYAKEMTKSSLHELDIEQKRILFELEEKGYCVIENFFNSKECSLLRNEVDFLIEEYKEQIWIDSVHSDNRIFGADRLSEKIDMLFQKNEFIKKIIQNHEKTYNINGFTMAAKMEYKVQNTGSGNGWHRDRADFKQSKAIVYLSDVDEKNGPFQFIEESHKSLPVIKNVIFDNFGFNQTRFEEKKISSIIEKYPEKLKTLTGKEGTLIITNTRGIHRGAPMETGVRYAFTMYNWPHEIPSHILSELIQPKNAK